MKKGFTMAEGATHVVNCNNNRKIAFTLAEVLITLGVIGVVAAITISVAEPVGCVYTHHISE